MTVRRDGSQVSSDSSPINGGHLASDFWAIRLVSSQPLT